MCRSVTWPRLSTLPSLIQAQGTADWESWTGFKIYCRGVWTHEGVNRRAPMLTMLDVKTAAPLPGSMAPVTNIGNNLVVLTRCKNIARVPIKHRL